MVFEQVWEKAKGSGKTIVLPEGIEPRVIEGAKMLVVDNICKPILLGDESAIKAKMKEIGVEFSVEIQNPATSPKVEQYANHYYEKRKHKGMTIEEATKSVKENNTLFGAIATDIGDADGCISGAITTTADVLKAAFTTIGPADGVKTISSCFVMDGKDKSFGENGVLFFADCAVNPFPDEEALSDIAIATADTCKSFGFTPRVAMLSFSTKGSNNMDEAQKIVRATELVRKKRPDLMIDGELQLDAAIVPSVAKTKAPDSDTAGTANCLIFPDINAGNIGYKLAQRFGGMLAVGPLIQGLKKPMNDLSRGTNAQEIAYIAALQSLSTK